MVRMALVLLCLYGASAYIQFIYEYLLTRQTLKRCHMGHSTAYSNQTMKSCMKT